MSTVEELRATFEMLLEESVAPDLTLDPGVLIERGGQMLEARQPHIDRLRALLDDEPELLVGQTELRSIRDQILRRDEEWDGALRWARGELAHRRQASQRARQARRAYGVAAQP